MEKSKGATFDSRRQGKRRRWSISGAPEVEPNTIVVWLVNLDTYAVEGRVTQVGNESWLIAAFQGK